MDLNGITLSLSNGLHRLEGMSIPWPSATKVLVFGAVSIPVAVFLNDTSDYWLPKTVELPVIGWFARRWKKNPESKMSDLSIARNFLLFMWMAASMHEAPPMHSPLDYVLNRLTNTTTRRGLTHTIVKNRTEAFAAAGDVLGPAALDEAKVKQQFASAVRRRQSQLPDTA